MSVAPRVRVSPAAPLDVVSLVGCGVATGVGAVRNRPGGRDHRFLGEGRDAHVVVHRPACTDSRLVPSRSTPPRETTPEATRHCTG